MIMGNHIVPDASTVTFPQKSIPTLPRMNTRYNNVASRIWTISNSITLLRFVLIIPIAILLYDSSTPSWVVLLLMTIAVATDALDGYFARKLNQITELGKILDPIADKVAIGVIASILTVQGRFPIWLFSAIIVRDLLILTGGIYLKNKYHLVLQSNWMGKWTVVSIALCLLLAVLNNPSLDIWTTIISLITGGMVLGSFVSYGWRFVIVTRSSSKT